MNLSDTIFVSFVCRQSRQLCISVKTSLNVVPTPGCVCFFAKNALICVKDSWHFKDFWYRSSLDMSTPKLPTGAWTFVLITGPKCFKMSFSVLHPTVTYLKQTKPLNYKIFVDCQKTMGVFTKIYILLLVCTFKVPLIMLLLWNNVFQNF